MVEPRRGDLVLVREDPDAPAEPVRTRLALVVSADAMNRHAPEVLVAPVTSELEPRYPSDVVLPAARTGLGHEGKVRLHRVRPVERGRLLKVLGRLPEDLMRLVDERLLAVFGL